MTASQGTTVTQTILPTTSQSQTTRWSQVAVDGTDFPPNYAWDIMMMVMMMMMMMMMRVFGCQERADDEYNKPLV
jgi:hypothetical protein